jgi:hypothetical protein
MQYQLNWHDKLNAVRWIVIKIAKKQKNVMQPIESENLPAFTSAFRNKKGFFKK